MITYQTEGVEMPAIKKRETTAWIKAVAESYGKRVGDIAYIFCSDEKILEVNRQYLQHDYYTDIITFDYCEGKRLSGDLFISLDTVRTNAEQFGATYETELHRVIIHGVLHLVGINDKGPGEREIMEAAENKALEMLKEIGMPISKEQLNHIMEMEKEYLESEVIPLLKSELQPMVEKLLNKFHMKLEIIPNREMEIVLLDKTEKTDFIEASQYQRNGSSRSTSLGFSVHFPDGTIIKNSDAKATFLTAIKKLGLEKVALFKERTFKGFKLVDRAKRKDCDFICQEYVNGWYVYVAMSNDTKMELLSKVAKMLDVDLRIVKDDGKEYSEPQMFIQSKSSREHFSLNGSEPYNKRRFVLEAVKLFMRTYPTATFYDIKEAFPDRLQGSYGVAKKLDWVLEKERNGFDFRVRYSMNNDEILTSYDGVKFVVSNQWGNQFYRFAEWVKKTMGWEVESV